MVHNDYDIPLVHSFIDSETAETELNVEMHEDSIAGKHDIVNCLKINVKKCLFPLFYVIHLDRNM
jgi:hypothetical protein